MPSEKLFHWIVAAFLKQLLLYVSHDAGIPNTASWMMIESSNTAVPWFRLGLMWYLAFCKVGASMAPTVENPVTGTHSMCIIVVVVVVVITIISYQLIPLFHHRWLVRLRVVSFPHSQVVHQRQSLSRSQWSSRQDSRTVSSRHQSKRWHPVKTREVILKLALRSPW